MYDRQQRVDVKVRWHSLQHARRSLQAHTGVDVLFRQRSQVVRWITHSIELSEDEIPNLDTLGPFLGDSKSRYRVHIRHRGPGSGALAGQKFSSSSHPLDLR